VREKARRYHTAVHRLRRSLARRVERLLTAPSDLPVREPILDRYASF
jgi:hypothetical protein